jgi:hypothetical protein
MISRFGGDICSHSTDYWQLSEEAVAASVTAMRLREDRGLVGGDKAAFCCPPRLDSFQQ